MKSAAQADIFVGRRQEAVRLAAAIRERRSLLIHGLPDSGKTALVEHVLSRVSPGIASHCLRVSVGGTLQRLMQRQVMALFTVGDPVVQEAYRKQSEERRSAETWVRKQTSRRLRSLLFCAFDRGRYWIFWDDACGLGLSHFHFLREVIWMKKTPAYLLARGLGYEYLGQAGRLFWADEHRLELGPLSSEDAGNLLEAAVEREGLQRLDLDGFHEQVLEVSRGLPGVILKMAAMAGQPQYQFENKVKTKLIYTDYLVQLASRVRV